LVRKDKGYDEKSRSNFYGWGLGVGGWLEWKTNCRRSLNHKHCTISVSTNHNFCFTAWEFNTASKYGITYTSTNHCDRAIYIR
jgi:hypothetical protein